MSRTLSFVAERDYRRRHELNSVSVVPGEAVAVPARRVLPERASPTFIEAMPYFTFPSVRVTDLGPGTARGASNLVTTVDSIIHHDLYDLTKDVVPEVFLDRLRVSPDLRSAEWIESTRTNIIDVDSAGVFLDALSHNYAHWLTEVLPKVVVFAGLEAFDDCELLVDDGLSVTLLNSLDLLLGGLSRVRFVPKDAIVTARRLISVSPAGYVPFKRATRGEEGHSHGRFSPSALARMTETLRRNLVGKGTEAGPFSSRLFIRRRSHVRNLVNSDEIEREMVSRGFSVIEPETLSFEEQLVAFAGADIVVGATGSGIANLLFCPRGCLLVVLVPNFAQTPYWYWRMLAGAAGVEILHVAGDQLSPSSDPHEPHAPHADFAIPLQVLVQAVESVRATSRIRRAN